jgi:glycosyltransferase involved in cell wall biosynthesis
MLVAAARPGPLRRYFDGVDAVHYPLTIALPRVDVPSAVTLHDLQHLDLPELFPRSERLFRRLFWHRSVRTASIVIVPSAFVRDRLVERLSFDPGRVRVIHHGIDHELFTPGSETREPFVLYPAKTWPHKNHVRLLEAFALLRKERPELRLVLAGGDPLPAQDGVEQVGRGSPAGLVSLYRRASALVFPSLYEGFGQPPLEAMACGCPAAVSSAASLPEVCGDAARYFDPRSPEEIAAAVADVLDDPEPWRARGLERAAQFTWAESARRHEDAYRALLA